MPMTMQEVAIWGVLAGGLLTLAGLALAEWLAEGRHRPALRNLVFVALMGTAVILIVGLPETLWPRLDGRVLRMFKASLGPLAASVTLYYLGQWMGGLREDAVMNRITNWSAAVMGVLALGLALAALLAPPERFRSVFMATAVCNVLAVLPGFAASARAAMLGDRLARWMALATAVLGAMTTGLYLHGLYLHGLAMQGVAWPWLGTGTVLVTVVLTLGFFILTSALVGVRNREQRRLARLSRIQPGMEPATQLPTGSHLLTRVEDALWTAKRRQAQVGVVALYLDNLYEPLEGDNRSTEYQTGGDGGAHPPRGGLSLPGGHLPPALLHGGDHAGCRPAGLRGGAEPAARLRGRVDRPAGHRPGAAALCAARGHGRGGDRCRRRLGTRAAGRGRAGGARQRAGRRGGYAVLRLRGRATVVDGEAIGLKMR